jgi:hypothetical protein
MGFIILILWRCRKFTAIEHLCQRFCNLIDANTISDEEGGASPRSGAVMVGRSFMAYAMNPPSLLRRVATRDGARAGRCIPSLRDRHKIALLLYRP